jgi:hypothetical protein
MLVAARHRLHAGQTYSDPVAEEVVPCSTSSRRATTTHSQSGDPLIR